MKVTFKKEWLIKYKFWYMLAVIPPAAAAALFILSGVAAETMKKVIANGDAATKSKTPPPAGQVNEVVIAKFKAEADRVKGEEETVWRKAYQEQASIFSLPKGFVDNCHTADGYFAEEVRIVPKKLAECPPDVYKPLDPPKQGEQGKQPDPGKDKDKQSDQPGQLILVYGEVKFVNREFIELRVRDPKTKGKLKEMKFLRTPGVKLKDKDGKDVLIFKTELIFTQIPLNKVVSVFFQTGKYFGDQFTEPERTTFSKYYRTQLPAILDQVEPYDPVKGEGAVQLADFGYDKIARLREWASGDDVPAPEPAKSFHFMPTFDMSKVESSDDIWIAQENLWIQEEIFRLIRVANDYVSKFDRVDDPKTKTTKGKEGVFENPFWKVELKLDETKPNQPMLRAKFTNLLTRRQKLDFKLRIVTNEARNAEPEIITLMPGLPLQPKGAANDGDMQKQDVLLKPRVNRTGIFRVEQMLTWETAAVRKIEAIHISKVGKGHAADHRNFPNALMAYPNRWLVGGPNVPAALAQPQLKDKEKPGDPRKDKGPIAPPSGGAMGGTTPNAQPRERYTETPDALRRLPVAVVLIVEQGQVDRVQTAFNNSRFRFLTTQVQITHYPGSCRPPAYEAPQVADDDPVKQPGIDPMKRPGFDPMKQRFPPKGPGIMPPKDGKDKDAPRQRASANVSDELEANVELVIYGIITIYERIPGRAKAPNPT